LKSGHTKSCGCFSVEAGKERATTHGKSKTQIYSRWAGIIARCYDEAQISYPRYGGRGIKVCDRWRKSFENFYADMGDVPIGRQIDRIDNNGDYSPENCRWVSVIDNARNRRTTKMLTYEGRTAPLAVWAEEIGIPLTRLSRRIREGWSPEEALRKECR
jgi:hypothetical protein